MIDQVVGEPPVPDRWHPVALFGTGVGALERRLYDDRVGPGMVLAGAGVGAAALAGLALGSPVAGAYLACAGRALHDAAGAVGHALGDGEIDRARELLPALVGRDTAGLDGPGMARAVVESLAENTTDAIVAPALWTLAAGAAGAFVHRAGDTLDSMVGYRDGTYRRFGTAAARVDDVLAWVPARATAGLVALARPRRASEVVRAVRRDAPAHPSPNAGVAEAAFAAALGLQLGGGENRYGDRVECRPLVGRGREPEAADIAKAVDLSRDLTWLLAGMLGAAGLAGRARRARRRR
jgi:adenosylcobinamide-phosphate synthase